MERKISYDVYAVAFLLSVLTFLAGIYLGGLVNRSNYEGISDELTNVTTRVNSIQLILLLDSNSSSCPLYMSELSAIDKDIELLGYKLTYLEDTKQAYDPEVKKKYFVLEAESYLLSQKAHIPCNDSSVLLINFYSNTACENCKSQGSEILQARDELVAENISVKLFSFDGDLGSPVADSFKQRYNITSYPSIVINGKTYLGYLSSDSIKDLIRRNK